MRGPAVAMRQRELGLAIEPDDLALRLRLRRGSPSSFVLDGDAVGLPAWNEGAALLAIDPRPLELPPGSASPLESLERRVLERRAAGGTDATGVALVLAYEALDGAAPRGALRAPASEPRLLALEVDRSLRTAGPGRYLLTERLDGAFPQDGSAAETLERLLETPTPEAPAPARAVGPVATTLGREAYCRAVERVREQIREGQVYQANLCQMLGAEYRGDPWRFHRALASRARAPRSAFLEAQGLALASFSPEPFLRLRPPDRIETWPIKGTRARDADPEADRRSAEALAASDKDRAELLMIVDLERNDLGRVCRTGSVVVRELARLVSLTTLHHLVGCVEGRLRAGVGLVELLRATFPGGSISGAPKARAREILTALEPAERGWFTGSLLWLGDDGSLDSSILIRSVVFDGRRVRLGAGCGIVADSEPEQEWLECMHKARAPAEALGFAAEEAAG